MGCLYRDLIAENYISHNNQDYACQPDLLSPPPTSLHTHTLVPPQKQNIVCNRRLIMSIT